MRNVNKGRIDPDLVRYMADCVDHAKANGYNAYGVEFDGEEPCKYVASAYTGKLEYVKLHYTHYGRAELVKTEAR